MKIKFNIKLPIIIAIVGPSGSGKTTMANIMAENGIPTIVSYTTRPIRDKEINGKEHWFVKPEDKPDQSTMLAYTKFGGHEYWATESQVRSERLCTYVIDEKGLKYLKEHFEDKIVIFSVYIDRDIKSILNDEIDQNRLDRDKERDIIPLEEYDYIIHNNYPLEEFINRIKELTLSLL